MKNCNEQSCGIADAITENEEKPSGGASKFSVDVISDFICPWCLIAETRLQQALTLLNLNGLIRINWYPYELNPDMPEMGMDRKVYRTKKFGSWEHSLALDAQVKKAGQSDGLIFRHDLMVRTPSTFKAHRLMWWANGKTNQSELADKIFRAYFLEGKDIGDIPVLAEIGAEVGLDRIQIASFLTSTEGREAVRFAEKQTLRSGINSVPGIKIGQSWISGAQPIHVFIDSLQRAEA